MWRTGDSVKRGPITKAGNRRARRTLVECAWSGGIGRRALQHDDLGSYLDPAIEIRDVFVGEPASAGGVCDASMLVEASPISGMSSTSDYHPAKLEKHHDHLYHPVPY
jgi:hypothetical protein